MDTKNQVLLAIIIYLQKNKKDCYLYDLNISGNIEILNDISNELNIDKCSIEEEEENEELDSLKENEKFNIHIPEDYKNAIEKMEILLKLKMMN